MDDSRAAMVIAYQHIRERYNQLRTDHYRLKKNLKTQSCTDAQPVCQEIGNHIRVGSEQIMQSLCSSSSGIASLSSANPSVKEAIDVENRQECAHIEEVDILSICRRLECLAASRADESDSLLDIAVQLHSIADRISQPANNTSVNEIRTDRCGSVLQSANVPELPLVTSINTHSIEGELVCNSGADVCDLDNDFLLEVISKNEEKVLAQQDELRHLNICLNRQHSAMKELLERGFEKNGDSGGRSLSNDETWSIVN